MTRVSWLIPVRDGGPWLGEAVRSALAECDDADEVVVVDDGSEDDAASRLPDGVQVVRQARRGIVAALEHGRRVCRGEFLARLDADDRAVGGRIAAQLDALRGDPELAAVGGRGRLFTDHGSPPEGMRIYVEWGNGLTDPFPQLLVESPLLHPAVTMRADAVESVGGYRDAEVPEDYDLWLRLVAAGWRVRNLERDVVELRDHPGRLTRTDPRYGREAFDRCRQWYLGQSALSGPRRVVLWAGKAGGRPWLRWLLDQGHEVPMVIDIDGGERRRSVPVLPPESIVGADLDLLLVAVGSRGARDVIRRQLARLRPDLREGQDWWAVR